LAALLLLAAAPSCRSDNTDRIELLVRIGETRGEISAEVGDETRYLLSEVPHGLVLLGARSVIPLDGRLLIEPTLGPVLRGADRIVVAVKATIDSRSWTELPPMVVPVVGRDNGRGVDLALSFPNEWRDRTVQLHAIAWTPHAGSRTREDSEPIAVPGGALLEVGGGILAAARDQGDVRFRVAACRGGDCREILSEVVRRGATEWSDWRVSLEEFAGTDITLAFETELLGGAAGSYSLAVWSRPTVSAPARARNSRPNVILFSIDTLRADHLTSYGHLRDTAPKLRQWFEPDGVLFENTVAAATTTGPAHMTMFTSLSPTVHGIAEKPGVRAPPPITLAEVLRAAGYATGAVTEDGPLHARWGFGRGFDSYAENKSSDVMLPEGHVAATFDKAERWLRRSGDKPFFLFLHTFEVHYPYAPPARYAALFSGLPRNPGLPPDYAPALYDREIRHVDDQLDRFLTKLQGAGLLDNTLFIVTSDHGEEFLEHGFIGHGGNLHPEVVRVPLLVRGPGVAGGRRITAPVGHADLMPTILDLLGIEPPGVAMGRSLAAIVRGESDHIAEAPLYSEAWYETAMVAGGGTLKLNQPSIAVRHGDRKLIRSNAVEGGFTYRYYDLATDPDERRDLHGEQAAAVADLQELLAGYEPLMAGVRRRADAARARFGAGRDTGPEEVEIDPAVSEKLRALGYVE
jgi:arylsulfatase A-like enzyme